MYYWRSLSDEQRNEVREYRRIQGYPKLVIAVGKCEAKMGDFYENTVYLNNGDSFITNLDSNLILGEFKTIREIVDHVNKNPQSFSLTANASDSNRKP